jgi:hypothetical protein
MQPTPELPMPIDRFRRYDLVTKSYRGFAGPRLTRKLFSEISGIPIPTLKLHDKNPDVKLKPITQRRLVACQIAMRAHHQCDMLDDKAEIAAARAAAKAEAAKAKALDKLLDAALRTGRKPLPRKSKQQAIF